MADNPRLSLQALRSPLAGPFDLSLAAGACIAVNGPSGAGKSLFLRMIADLDPNEGEVHLDGRDRRCWSAPEWRRRAMYAAAEPGWWGERVTEHFPPAMIAPARALLPRLGLAPEMMGAAIAHLSTGERQRLALIRALVLDPPLLLLDEPTAGLDPAAILLVEAVLRERLEHGTAILMVTHSAEQAARLAGTVLRMEDRRLLPA